MRGAPIQYSKTELAWIKKNRTLPRRRAYAKFCDKFNRTNVGLKNYIGLCKRNGWFTGRTGHYEPGAEPANKGKKMPYNANSARTQFKKGQLPANTKFLGHERVSNEGYVEISIAQPNPHTGYERRYVLKHKHLWEKDNGPVPEGMCLKCLDDNRLNTDPSNWELIPRGALPFMNGFRGPDYAGSDPQVKPVVLTLAKLKYTRSTKMKQKPKTVSSNRQGQSHIGKGW